MPSTLSTQNARYTAEVKRYIVGAFLADVGKGDITSELFIPTSVKAVAVILAKQPGVLAGTEELQYFLKYCKKYVPSLSLTLRHKDGDMLKNKTTIGILKGSARDILLVERTLLNLLQRMSGIATLTQKFKNKMKAGVELAAIRKTHWGLLDKKAVSIGGGVPHRLGLYDAILIKDNHLTLLKKNFKKILEILIKNKPKVAFIEIEIASLEELGEFLQAFEGIKTEDKKRRLPLRILLDNMDQKQLKKAVQMAHKSPLKNDILLEASGGVNFSNIEKISQTGVNIISVGTLTHSAPALDISMKIKK